MKRITTLFSSLAVLTALGASGGLARPSLVVAAEPPAPGAIYGSAELDGLASPLVNATETITDNIPAIQGGFVTVPIIFSKSGNQITSYITEVRYDTAKLQLTLGPDSGGTRQVQSITFPSLPSTYIGGAFVRTGVESDIEISVNLDPGLASNPPNPLPQIPDGILANITFRVIAASPSTTPIDFELTDPPPSVGPITGSSGLPVSTDPGSVTISPATETINLVAGSNLIGFNVIPVNSAPSAVFGTLGTNVESVYGREGCTTWRGHFPALPFLSDLASIDIVHGYWVRVTSPATLIVTGTMPTYPVSIPLCVGQNLVSYPSQVNVALPGALNASLGTNWNAIFGEPFPWKAYYRTLPFISDLFVVGPGRGYWLDATTAGTLSVPTGP